MATINSAGLERIDDGPVATVYSGQQAGVVIALKVFPKRLDKRTLAAFNKEQAKLSTVRRVTSILRVDGVDELATGEFAVRMERCTQSLAALVDRVGSLPPADVVVLGRAVAVALAAAHGAGVVHGGMSPHNVLFRTTGEPVVADFGVTLRQAFARDPLYAIEFLPPETLRTGVLNEATDLYGLGAVLHYALSGRSPHPGRLGEQPGERVLRILGEPVPAINNRDVPVGLSTLVARLLAADPARRLGDASAVADQLGAMLPGSPQRPVADDFDDFSAPRPMPMPPAPPTRQAAPPPPVASTPADGDDFDDFAVPAYRAPSATPVSRPAVSPPPVAKPPVVRAPVARAPVVPPPPPVSPPAADEGADDHWLPEPEPAENPAAGTPDRAARLRALRRERIRSASSTSRPADSRPAEPAEQTPQDVPAPPLLPLATLTPAPTQPPAEPPAAPLAPSPAEPPAAPLAPSLAEPLVEPPAGSPSALPVEPPAALLAVPLAPSLAEPLVEPPAGSPSALPVEPLAVPPSALPAEPLAELPALPATLPAEPAAAPPVESPVEPLAEPPTAALPAPATVEFKAQARPPAAAARARPDLDFDDDFADVADPVRGRAQARVLASPLAPPGQAPKKLIRYDVLAGAALLLALLALVPLLLLRGDPEEISSVPRVPPANGSTGGDVEIELAEPVDLTDEVRLSWSAPDDLDFIVVVAAEGKETQYELAERNRSMTLPVEGDLKYCFMVQGHNGNDTYESNVVSLRNATCKE